MKYCKKCWMPDTKPGLKFGDEGICFACLAHEVKRKIDWLGMERQFRDLCRDVISLPNDSPIPYEIVVPVSGGKDSFAQVDIVRRYGLRVLAVSVDYGIKTDVGRRNLETLARYADLVTYCPEMATHKALILKGFEQYGDPDYYSHPLIYAYPMRLAAQMGIPFVAWGENAGAEYLGDDFTGHKSLDRPYFYRHVAWGRFDQAGLPRNYCLPFSLPRNVFLGHYFRWDSEENLKVALRMGFEPLSGPREGTYRSYVGIDEKINRVHQYLKVCKFGYGRATDHACEDIRNGRLTREAARKLILEHDFKPLSNGYVYDFCDFLNITFERFYATIDRFINRNIWKKDGAGNWKIQGALLEE